MNNPAKTNIFNLANLLTLSRVFLSIPLIIALHALSNNPITDNVQRVLLILFLIVFSDILDGYVARKMNIISNFGKLLDPIADKICLMVVLIFLIFQSGNQGLAMLLFFILLCIRDVYIIIIGVYLIHVQNTIFQANKSGKYFMAITVLMMTSFVFRLSFNIPINLCWFLYILSLLLMVISGYEYHNRYIKYFNREK